ncbi:zinc finger protein 219 isoform X2 [Drosophila gunungcola]|uniref:zinc finger protein 219 isoform X2 n=1 Tax=Drosophila gunungcola TaxID=103775 RepID=UPI0022E6CD8B|nr:zinc finger protein 219 isoform X2 [Drosophila gunungcola]
MDMDRLNPMPAEFDSDVEIIETEPMDNRHHYLRQPGHFMLPARMYPKIPSDFPLSPPLSPTDDPWPSTHPGSTDMPLLKELLARNGQINVPPGFVLCIPCYLCRQPFNDIDSFKEHLTQHAADIHAWNTSRAQAQEPQPMFKHHHHHPHHHHPNDQPMGPYQPYHLPMEYVHQPPLDLYSAPIQPPMAFPMPPAHHHAMQPPPMHYPLQHSLNPPHLEMPPQPPLEFQGPLPMTPQSLQEFPGQPVFAAHLNKPQFPLQMLEQRFSAPERRSIPEDEPAVPVKAQVPKPVQIKIRAAEHRKSPPKNPKPPSSTKGQFECEFCGKRLSSRQSVKYHESHFHSEEELPAERMGKNVQKQHRCSTCKKRYKRRTFLLMHMKVKHGIINVPAPGSPDVPASPEAEVSPEAETLPAEEPGRSVWSTRICNALATAKYEPARERADKYVNAPRQQSDQLESGFATKPKRTYPMRSPFFNPDLWLDCDAYF